MTKTQLMPIIFLAIACAGWLYIAFCKLTILPNLESLEFITSVCLLLQAIGGFGLMYMWYCCIVLINMSHSGIIQEKTDAKE